MNESMRFDICEKCPGTKWGKKSTCSIHQLHIGKIQHCEGWDRHQVSDVKDHDGQLAFFDLEPAMEFVEKTWEDLTSFHWMVNEIDRLKKYLDQVLDDGAGIGSMVAQYGIEATLPKGQGLKLSTLSITEERYEKQIQRLKRLEAKVKMIEEAAEKITDLKERAVIECILDGEKMNFIARHVGISRQRLNEIRRSLIKKVAWELYRDELKGA